ncbi:hypothetical protein N7501_011151 [Penicillium viridicatum]|nr:hypothetical protein N7501_011151 [Penicillium viridicatum]
MSYQLQPSTPGVTQYLNQSSLNVTRAVSMPIRNATATKSGSRIYVGAFTSSNCIASPSIGVGPPQPNQSLRILQLSSATDVGGRFRLVHDTLNNRGIRDIGTLVTNSVSTRSEEIHIHVCDHPGSTVRGILEKLHRDNSKTTSSVDLSALPKPSAAMSCRASPNKGRDIIDWLTQYASTTSCAQYDVGAGVIVDSNGYAWACIITGYKAAETLFCIG